MDAILNVIAPIFWGLIVLSVLVFIHEGGHFLAARLSGVRVTEFFLGLPCRWGLRHTSRKIGTTFGATPLLLGGYAQIAGMDPTDAPQAPRVLAYVHEQGRASVEEIARDLAIDEDAAMEACVMLLGWGSLAPVYDASKGEVPGGSYYPTTYAAPARDRAGNTVFDGAAFDRAHATAEGEPWELDTSPEEFLARERSHTYLGVGFWKRAFMLAAGVAVNIVAGFLLLMSIYSLVGLNVAENVNRVGSVQAGSVAEEAGIVAGDSIVSVDGNPCETWVDVTGQIAAAREEGPFEIVYAHEGAETAVTVEISEDEGLGINASVTTVRLNPMDSARMSFSYVRMTAQSVLDLINPQRTIEVLEGSTSIVGISVLSAEAAAQGPSTLLTFASLISFSLGFMNLLPIPPLDGGKLVIEIVQAIIKRPVPLKVQTGLSYVGVALFGCLFLYMLRADIIRFIL